MAEAGAAFESRASRSEGLSLYVTAASLEVLQSWIESLQGRGGLSKAIERICRLSCADLCLLSHFDVGNETPIQYSTYAKSAGKLFSARNCRCLFFEIVGDNLFSAVEGSVWRQSEVVLLPARLERRPLLDGSGLPLREVFSIVLSNSKNGVDVLELQYRVAPTQANCAIIELIAASLSRSWKNRLPGIAREQTPRLANEIEGDDGDCVRQQILTHNNPSGLSRTEFRVCLMVRDGMKVSKIADSLGVETGTVRGHLSTIYSKVGVSGQLELLHRLVS